MRRPKLRLLLGLGIPLLVIVLLLAGWAIDSSSTHGKVPRNVTLAGRDISKLPEDALAATVADIATTYANAPVQLRTTDRTFNVPAAKLGLRLDQAATIKAALDINTRTAAAERPLVWISSFLDKRKASLEFTIDPAVLQQGLDSIPGNADVNEPKVIPTGTGFGIISGSAGRRIAPSGIASALMARASSGELPMIVDATATDQPPVVTDKAAQALADRLTADTARGLAVTAGATRTTVPANTLRAWLGATVSGGRLHVTLDARAATSDLMAALPQVTKAKDASFTVVNGLPTIVPSVQGARCCAADTAARLLAAVNRGTGQVALELEVAKPAFSTADAAKLGIKEPVGGVTVWKGQPQVKSFTTYYMPGAPRVINIHRIADLVRGTIVKPGESFSMNGTVGQRTVAKGFVFAPAIANGVEDSEVGGGVSQFATTMFNAAFFDGLPLRVYQSHTEILDRYPFGREATMGFPRPDLVWHNDTPYGILIWTSYTDTSVTVSLYSTQYASADQTGQTQSRDGHCTHVTTQRTIKYADGRTAQDTVGALYIDMPFTTC